MSVAVAAAHHWIRQDKDAKEQQCKSNQGSGGKIQFLNLIKRTMKLLALVHRKQQKKNNGKPHAHIHTNKGKVLRITTATLPLTTTLVTAATEKKCTLRKFK